MFEGEPKDKTAPPRCDYISILHLDLAHYLHLEVRLKTSCVMF